MPASIPPFADLYANFIEDQDPTECEKAETVPIVYLYQVIYVDSVDNQAVFELHCRRGTRGDHADVHRLIPTFTDEP